MFEMEEWGEVVMARCGMGDRLCNVKLSYWGTVILSGMEEWHNVKWINGGEG